MGIAVSQINDNDHDFIAFCDFLKKSSGIVISSKKSYLVSSRIRHIMEDYEFSELSQLLQKAKTNQDLIKKIIDAMTTNETFWFRDVYPFEYFSNTLLPTLNSDDNRSHSIKIWSAACSSGQEPYSLSILCEEYKEINKSNKKVEIIATDLSSHILNKAKAGIFDHLSIERGLSSKRISNFFTQNHDNEWKINPPLKNYIKFEPINLLESFSAMGKFDVIFCRNVLIYFDKDTKMDILQRLHQSLKPGGTLFLGSSESLSEATSLFSVVHCHPGIVFQAN